MMELKSIRVVAALISSKADRTRFLVQQRLPDKSRGNLWEFPGGKVEDGESDEEALSRECREELGIELRVGQRLVSTHHAYSDVTVQLELFSAEAGEGVPQPLGAQAIRFCTLAEMRGLDFCEADLPVLQALEALIAARGPAQ